MWAPSERAADRARSLRAVEFLGAIEEREDASLTEADRAYLRALEARLDMYPEMRTTG